MSDAFALRLHFSTILWAHLLEKLFCIRFDATSSRQKRITNKQHTKIMQLYTNRFSMLYIRAFSSWAFYSPNFNQNIDFWFIASFSMDFHASLSVGVFRKCKQYFCCCWHLWLHLQCDGCNHFNVLVQRFWAYLSDIRQQMRSMYLRFIFHLVCFFSLNNMG